MYRKTLTRVRLNLVFTVPFDYFKSYKTWKKGRLKMREPYRSSFNRFYFSVVKELWITGKTNTNRYKKV